MWGMLRSTAPIRDLGLCTDRQHCVPVRDVVEFIRDTSRWRRAPTTNDYGAVLHGAAGSPATAHLTIAPGPDDGIPSPLPSAPYDAP